MSNLNDSLNDFLKSFLFFVQNIYVNEINKIFIIGKTYQNIILMHVSAYLEKKQYFVRIIDKKIIT